MSGQADGDAEACAKNREDISKGLEELRVLHRSLLSQDALEGGGSGSLAVSVLEISEAIKKAEEKLFDVDHKVLLEDMASVAHTLADCEPVESCSWN
eukprot:749853-Hanusia_phi.AAC.6